MKGCLLGEMKAVKYCILSTYSISCRCFLLAHLPNHQAPGSLLWSLLGRWAQAETPALPVTPTPLKPRDESGLHEASLLLHLGSPGNGGQGLSHTYHQGAWDCPPAETTAAAHSALCCNVHEAPWPSLGMVALEKPDAQASLAQALPADPIQGPSWAVMGGGAYYVLRDGEKRTLCVVACPADANTETPFPKGLAPMGDVWVQACPPTNL